MPEIVTTPAQAENVQMTIGEVQLVNAVSPRVTLTPVDDGTLLTVEDVDGIHTATIYNGEQGEQGPEGPEGPPGADGHGVPAGGTTGQVLKKASATDYDTEWADDSAGVTDVQVDGTSVVYDGVAHIPMATPSSLGVVRKGSGLALDAFTGELYIPSPTANEIKSGTGDYKAVTIGHQHESTFYGLAKAAGDTTQSASSNAVGTYTETAKSKISDMLNAPVTVSGTTPTITALSGIQYVCGEVATLDITLPASGCVDVVFESGSTATVLTVTPPTGVTLKWANGFDPSSLDANTTYEINIADGLGVAASWT